MGWGGNDGDKDFMHMFIKHLIHIDEIGLIFIFVWKLHIIMMY